MCPVYGTQYILQYEQIEQAHEHMFVFILDTNKCLDYDCSCKWN